MLKLLLAAGLVSAFEMRATPTGARTRYAVYGNAGAPVALL